MGADYALAASKLRGDGSTIVSILRLCLGGCYVKAEIALVHRCGPCVIGLLASPASAMRMDKRNARHGCASLVTVAHPDLKGKARRDEIKKCKADPDGYSKASGI